VQTSGLKSLKPAVKCDNKKQPGKVIFSKFGHQLFLSLSGMERALPQAFVFHDERCEAPQ
jgi:hypothetical protein